MIRVTLGAFVQAHAEQIASEPIIMSLPGNVGFARFATIPAVDAKTLRSMIEYEAKQQIPFPIEEVQTKILALDLPKRRISLSIKALKDAPVRQESQGRDGGRDGGRSGGRDRGEAVQPREADPSMRKLLSKFGGNDKNLKGGLS